MCGMECHEQQQEYLTLCPAAPPGDVTLVVAVDAAGRVVELEVAGGGHAYHVNVLKGEIIGCPVLYFVKEREVGNYLNGHPVM